MVCIRFNTVIQLCFTEFWKYPINLNWKVKNPNVKNIITEENRITYAVPCDAVHGLHICTDILNFNIYLYIREFFRSN